MRGKYTCFCFDHVPVLVSFRLNVLHPVNVHVVSADVLSVAGPSKRFPCGECGNVYALKSLLDAHSRVHVRRNRKRRNRSPGGESSEEIDEADFTCPR